MSINLNNLSFRNINYDNQYQFQGKMSKGSFLKKLRDVTKSIPGNMTNIKNNTVDKVKEAYDKANVEKVLEKTKQKLGDKQQTMKNYAHKVKDATQNTSSEVARQTQKLIKAASEYKEKINSSTEVSKKKEQVSAYIQKIKATMKRQNKTQESQKQKQKQIIHQQIVKVKPKEPQKVTIFTPKQQQIRKNNQVLPEEKYSLYYIAQRVMEKSRKAHQYVFSKMIVNQTRGIFSKLFTNLYWRFLFAVCLVSLIFVSPQLIKHIGDIVLQYRKLQQEKQEKKQLLKASVSSSTQTD